MFRLKGDVEENRFLDQVIARSGQNLLQCLQCGKCSGSCPITSRSVGGPRRLIARILAGMQDDALRDATWWYCISCGTCASRCPVEINLYAVSNALCEMAAEQGVEPAEPGIHLFEKLFLESIEKNGRVRELHTLMAYNLRSLRPFNDALLGARMALKGAISPAAMLRKGRRDPKVARICRNVRLDRKQKASKP
jgi:heterodisulfide reductase subunit C2